MGLVSTIRAVLASAAPADRSGTSESLRGAYWCHDCAERTPAADAPDEGAPACPACGEAMTFERAFDSAGCAC